MPKKKLNVDLRTLRSMVKNFYDFQDMRIRYAGRIRIKADETPQKDNGLDPLMTDEGVKYLEEGYSKVQELEKEFAKDIKEVVESTDEWKLFLKDVKGVGPALAAVLISEIDITKANTVSAIWQYAGLNPQKTVYGRVKKEGKVVTTDTLIRGDKLVKGYLAPYNQFLKSKLMGVLATSFIKCKSPYAKFYYDNKTRLETSTRVTRITGEKEVMWKDTTASHRDLASKRFMIQMFLVDYYKAVRQMHGLPVRDTYAEEKLGIVHHK